MRAFILCLLFSTPLWSDPCGMVPPVSSGDGPAIERIGLQQTYVFWKDGIETIVIRPGFSGRVDSFGMLIPFPSPPVLRKVPDGIFAHLAAAVDPPEVVVEHPGERFALELLREKYSVSTLLSGTGDLRLTHVEVIRQEAVGM